jgi:hypothetical protein
VDNVYYAAVECVDVNTGKRTVHAEVCAIRRDDEFTGKLFWKQMHEPGKVLAGSEWNDHIAAVIAFSETS